MGRLFATFLEKAHLVRWALGTHIVVVSSVYYKKNVPCRGTLMIFLTHGLYRRVTFNSASAIQ